MKKLYNEFSLFYYILQAVVQLDLHLATESDPNNGKALIHTAAASGSLSIIKVSSNVCMATAKIYDIVMKVAEPI